MHDNDMKILMACHSDIVKIINTLNLVVCAKRDYVHARIIKQIAAVPHWSNNVLRSLYAQINSATVCIITIFFPQAVQLAVFIH